MRHEDADILDRGFRDFLEEPNRTVRRKRVAAAGVLAPVREVVSRAPVPQAPVVVVQPTDLPRHRVPAPSVVSAPAPRVTQRTVAVRPAPRLPGRKPVAVTFRPVAPISRLPVRIPAPVEPPPREVIRMTADVLELDMADEIEPTTIPLGAESFVHKRVIGAIAGLVSGGPVAAVTGFVSPTRFTGSNRGEGLGLSPSCPPGTRADASGRCATTGVRGAIERVLPGGSTGFQPASSGLLGMLQGGPVTPAEVGSITRNDGSVGPILRCPPGMVLAVDDQCYAKGLKGLAHFRKWKPPAKPFLTGGEVKILRRADTLRKGKSTRKTLKALGLG